ncbi:hypothetical protein [Chitinophaga sp. MM2321]|uniref:hypothetical protein n=1 Tax=Chitinophaga sp. MM2321 TaxID=3137178 RepID=UPI0032D59A18
MAVTLQIAFNSLAVKEFQIINPQVLPAEGEIVDFKWDDFITDPGELELLENNDQTFVCSIVFKSYTASDVKIMVVLHEEQEYNARLYNS